MDILRRAFGDISRGSSAGFVLSRACHIRHLSYRDQIDFDAKRDEFYAQAKGEGLPTDEERLIQLRIDGEWSEARDREIEDSRRLLQGLHEGKRKHTKMPSMVKRMNEEIAAEENKLRERLTIRANLIGLTCEAYAERSVNDFYIYCNIYKDSGLANLLFSEDQFDYLTDQEMGQIVADYNAVLLTCTDQNIKKLAMQPFFQRYFGLVGDQLTQFFGKPICDLTFYQVEVLRYGAHFRHLFGSHDVSSFPKEVTEDPDLLTDYAMAADKGKQDMQTQGAFEEGSVVVGLNKEDAKVTGVKTQASIAQEIQTKHGGRFIDWAMKNAR